MFKKLKESTGKIEKPISPTALLQNRPSWRDFSNKSPLTWKMEDSRFCIVDDTEDSDSVESFENSPTRVTTSNKDLGECNQSSSSATNDHLSLHTDIESGSKVDDSVSVVPKCADEVTKENVYAAYNELHGPCRKYTEIADQFKKALVAHDKIKINMTKVQDKLLQKIADLKEQCTLEQAAKAHMEEALRNDIEERDYKISTLNTKIDLLKESVNFYERESPSSVNFMNSMAKCKRLVEELSSTKLQCASLENQIESLKKCKDSTLLSLVENKMAVHKEVEAKEDQIEKLKRTISELQMENKLLKEKASHSSTDSYQVTVEELQLKMNDYKISNEKLQDAIKLIQEEKESVVKTMKMKIDENQLGFDNLNEFHTKTLSELNEEKLNTISEERSIESVIKDYNLLTEENANLKKERLKVLQTCQDVFKEIKIDYESVKSFAKDQLTEWPLIFVDHIKQMKAEYSSQTTLYNNNLIEMRKKLDSIQKAYFALKSNCSQSMEYFKIEIIDKYNKDIMTNVLQNNEELERNKIDLLRLHKEIDYYKKREKSVKAGVKGTIQELQDCVEMQKKAFTDLQNEYSDYQVTEKKKWTDKCIEIENKWLMKMDNYKQITDAEHRGKVDALIEEWTNVQKVLEKIVGDFETTSRQKESREHQFTKLNKELSELKKMYRNEMRNKLENIGEGGADKSACEMEYLRNVLYDYMMGKHPMVLAKVLAAIVKFDYKQLSTVLKREEQKLRC